MDLVDDIFPSYARLVTRCERITIRESKARNELPNFGDPWYIPHTDTFHYRHLNKLLTERLLEVFIQRYTTVKLSTIRHYHDQFSTGKVMVHLRLKDRGRHVGVGMVLPRLIMERPVWYPNYHSPKRGYWRGTISDIVNLQACGIMDKLRLALYRYLKPNEGFASRDEQITHDTLCFIGFSPEDVKRWHQENDRSPEEMEEFKRMTMCEFPVTQHTRPNQNNRMYVGSPTTTEFDHPSSLVPLFKEEIETGNVPINQCNSKVDRNKEIYQAGLGTKVSTDSFGWLHKRLIDDDPSIVFSRATPTALGGYLQPYVVPRILSKHPQQDREDDK